MEGGEGMAFASEEKKPLEDEKKIKIRFSVFFDGTLNNRTNIEQRLVSTSSADLSEDEQKIAEELKQKMSVEELKKAQAVYQKHAGGDNSYENGFTNIVKLERYLDTTEPPKNYDLMLKTYIDGPGTREKKKDDALGYGLGMGILSGVKTKVKKGVRDVVFQISDAHSNTKGKIEKLTVDVFGFSRGAAAARHFIHKALLAGNTVKKQLESTGYQVDKVEVHFTGLFDTVSSHGLDFSNDTAELNLDAIIHAKQVVQLAAADEHRENFSLTTIESAKAKGGIQLFLPGVHSDVGGSYRDNAAESQDIFFAVGRDSEDKAENEKTQLLAAGWYNEDTDKLTVHKSKRNLGGKGRTIHQAILQVQRDTISNSYSRIPLQVMATFTRENDLKIDSELEMDESIPSSLATAHTEIKRYIDKHKAKGAYSSQADHWLSNNKGWLKTVRHDYLHFSAKCEFGLWPRYINNKRCRRYYEG